MDTITMIRVLYKLLELPGLVLVFDLVDWSKGNVVDGYTQVARYCQ